MFPYTSAGPIVRYTDIETQLKQRTINISKFGIGAELFVKGLAKKVLLADNLSVLYSSICGHPQMSVFTSWLGILAYTMQLYFDFSGYSDMAIGLGKCWDLILIRTLIIPIFPPVFLNSGDAGIFLLEAGSEIIFISRLAVIGSPL